MWKSIYEYRYHFCQYSLELSAQKKLVYSYLHLLKLILVLTQELNLQYSVLICIYVYQILNVLAGICVAAVSRILEIFDLFVKNCISSLWKNCDSLRFVGSWNMGITIMFLCTRFYKITAAGVFVRSVMRCNSPAVRECIGNAHIILDELRYPQKSLQEISSSTVFLKACKTPPPVVVLNYR